MRVKALTESNKELSKYIKCTEFTKSCADLVMKFTAHKTRKGGKYANDK